MSAAAIPLRTSVKASDCGSYFLWAAADGTNQLYVCASCTSRADAAAQADIWLAAYEQTGDPKAATDTILAIRGAAFGARVAGASDISAAA